jgi:Sugar phosphate isomerases/epimerases
MLNIGIRAHDMGQLSLTELSQQVKEKQLHAVQLAMGKSFGDIYTGHGCMSSGMATFFGQAFAKNEVTIAVLGCYINMIHPDEKIRKNELKKFKEMLRYASDFGCKIVGTETGTVNPQTGFTLDNYAEEPFLLAVESIKELVREAEKFGVIVGIEGGVNHPINDIYKLKRMIDLVDSDNLQIIFDPVNFITMDNYQNQVQLFEESFKLFGNRMTILHMKDFIVENNQIKIVQVGEGLLDYVALFKILKAKKPYMFSLLEGTTGTQIDKAIKHVQQAYEQV